jgi:hypothetical protein
MKLPRQVCDDEIALMLSLAEFHLERSRPFVALVRHHPGTGVISARHRKAFADWLDERREQLQRDDSAIVVVMPEAIYRAVLRVVYRFRAPPAHADHVRRPERRRRGSPRARADGTAHH